MSIPGWMVVAVALSAMSAVYMLFMAPLYARLPSELNAARTEDELRATKGRFRRMWSLLASASFLASTSVTLILAAFTRGNASNQGTAPGYETASGYIFVLVLVGVVGLVAGWFWAGTQIRIASAIAGSLLSAPPDSQGLHKTRVRTVGLFLAGSALLGLLFALLAVAEIVPGDTATAVFIGMGVGTALLATVFCISMRVRRGSPDDHPHH